LPSGKTRYGYRVSRRKVDEVLTSHDGAKYHGEKVLGLAVFDLK